MMNKNYAKVTPLHKAQNMSAIVQKISELSVSIEQLNATIEQYKADNPDVDVDAILSERMELLPMLGFAQRQELHRFVEHAKEQGTKMSFDAMEMGVLAAGRKDMQNGLAEIVNSLKFDKPICPECGEGTDDRGRSKKKF